MNVIIQAGPVQADIPGQIPVTRPDLVQLVQQLYRLLHRPCTRIRPVIPGFVLLHPSCKQHPGIGFLHRHFNKRITLVILEHGVVFGTVLFDQVALQHQRLQLGIRDDILKPGNLGHHPLNLGALVPAGLKILPHPVFQADGLAHVNDGIRCIVHNIDARFPGQFF